MRYFLAPFTLFIMLLTGSSSVYAQHTPDDLHAMKDYWTDPKLNLLPFCSYPGAYPRGIPFPAKDHDDGTPCNDGDSVPFNGLTCAAGDDRGCIAVRDSQGNDGVFYRSPKKRWEIENNLPTSTETAASNDSAQGVWAYIAQKGDVDAFRRWTGWMKGHRQAGIWPQYCLDKNCAFNPSDCPMLDRLAVYLKEGNALCNLHPDIRASKVVATLQRIFDDLKEAVDRLPGAKLFLPQINVMNNLITEGLREASKAADTLDEIREKIETLVRVEFHAPEFLAWFDSWINSPGAARQDVAYSVYMLKKYGGLTGPAADKASKTVKQLEHENAFFEYVAENGPTQTMIEQIVAKCPSKDSDKPHVRNQWIWERTDLEAPPPSEHTMYWDCLFVVNLYDDGKIDSFNMPASQVYFGNERIHLEGEFEQKVAAVNTFLKTLNDILQSFKDPSHPPSPSQLNGYIRNARDGLIANSLPGPAADLDRAVNSLIPQPGDLAPKTVLVPSPLPIPLPIPVPVPNLLPKFP
jgi:hypothetical protein